jgi:hypothetical protein
MLRLVIWVWLLVLVGWPAELGADEVFKLNHRSRTSPDAMITEVRITDRETIVQIEYRNTTGPGWVRVFPPGGKHSFFLMDKQSSRKYTLTKNRGVPVYPKKAVVNKGSRLSLTLWFKAVPFSKYDLLEGDVAPEEGKSWHFYDIDLQGDWREFADDGEPPKMISNAPGE